MNLKETGQEILPGFFILSTIIQEDFLTIYLAQRTPEGENVFILEIADKNTFTFIKENISDYNLEPIQSDEPYLLCQGFQGTSLKAFINENSHTLISGVKIAILLLQEEGKLGPLKPENIYFNAKHQILKVLPSPTYKTITLEDLYPFIISLFKIKEQNLPPQAIEIILKLRNAEFGDKYRNRQELASDLEELLKHLEKHTEHSSALFGRKKEKEEILQYDSKAAKGAKLLLLIQGKEGIGKKLLVKSLLNKKDSKEGIFLEGSFGNVIPSGPYSGFIEAFNRFIQSILNSDETVIEEWRTRLNAPLGKNASLLARIFPDLEKLLGPWPAKNTLLDEREGIFLATLEQFISIFPRPGAPLVILFNNIQWADSSSLKLLETVLSNPKSSNLLLVGTHTHPLNNENSPIYKFYQSAKNSKTINELQLGPLSLADCLDILEYHLETPKEQIIVLGETLFSKVEGNPLFLIELVQYLKSIKYIDYNESKKQLEWDLEKIRYLKINSLQDLILLKFNKLSPHTKKMLSIASCYGHAFDKPFILSITDNDMDPFLEEALRESFLKETSIGHYDFIHEKYSSVIYGQIPDEFKKRFHLQIGLYLKEGLSLQTGDEIFDAVNHINKGKEFLKDSRKDIEASKLNLVAASRSMRSIAYAMASEYLKTALWFLRDNTWETNYDLTQQIHLKLAECLFLKGSSEEATMQLNLIYQHAKNENDYLSALLLKIKFYISTANYEDAINSGRYALSLLGFHLPQNWLKLRIFKEMILSKIRLGMKPIEVLTDLPKVNNEKNQKILTILGSLFPPTYLSNKNLLAFYILKSMNYMLVNGRNHTTPFVIISYGLLMGTYKRNMDFTYALGKLALQLNEQYEEQKWSTPVHFLYGALILPFKVPLKQSIDHLKIGSEQGLAEGDFIYGIFALVQYLICKHIQSYPLNDLLNEINSEIDFATKIKEDNRIQALIGLRQTFLALQGETIKPFSLSVKEFDEDMFIKHMKEKEVFNSLYIVKTLKAELFYLFNNYDSAVDVIEKSEAYMTFSLAQPITVENRFYYALSLAKSYTSKDTRNKNKILKNIKAVLEQFKGWSGECPANYKQKYKLIEAEIALITGDKDNIIKNYDEAISLSELEGFTKVEAMACERFSEYWTQVYNPSLAKQYMEQAYNCYRKWGAEAKLKDLETRYPYLKDKRVPLTQKEESAVQFYIKEMIEAYTMESLISKILETAYLLMKFEKITFVKVVKKTCQGLYEISDEGVRPCKEDLTLPINLRDMTLENDYIKLHNVKNHLVCPLGNDSLLLFESSVKEKGLRGGIDNIKDEISALLNKAYERDNLKKEIEALKVQNDKLRKLMRAEL